MLFTDGKWLCIAILALWLLFGSYAFEVSDQEEDNLEDGYGGDLLKVSAQDSYSGLGSKSAQGLVASEDIKDGETILRMPLLITMNKWTMKRMVNSPARHLKSLAERNEEWLLAVMLVHEYTHKKNSRWWPFIQTLVAYDLGPGVIRHLQGSSVSATLAGWNDEVEDFFGYCTNNIFRLHSSHFLRNPGRAGMSTYNRDDLAWALNVVRKHAIWIENSATKDAFLALVPFANGILHDSSAGGNALLTSTALADVIHISVAAHREGQQVLVRGFFEGHGVRKLREVPKGGGLDSGEVLGMCGGGPGVCWRLAAGDAWGVLGDAMGDLWTKTLYRRVTSYTDGESMAWRHTVSASNGEDSQVTIALPDAASAGTDVIGKVRMLRSWRRNMGLPPRAGDLLAANEMLLQHGRPEDYQLPMLEGATGDEAETGQVAHVYAVMAGLDSPMPNTKEHAMAVSAADTLDTALNLLPRLEHAGFTDPATVAALNTAQDFLLHGVEPRKGLDELDRVLIRKMALRQDCGPTRAYTIGWERISLELLCATRLTLVAEPELDLLCPKPWSWNDQCTGAVFKWRQPISRENEEAVIASLRNTIHGLLGGYPTAVEEDQALLELPQLLHVREHSAVLLRMREKLLLRNALTLLQVCNVLTLLQVRNSLTLLQVRNSLTLLQVRNSLTLLQELEMGLDTAQYQAPTIPKWRAPLMLAP
eukprot:gene14077-16642_t